METMQIPIDLATELISNKIKTLNDKQIKNLSKQIIRTVQEHIQDFLNYVENPEKFSMDLNGHKVTIGNSINCMLNCIWNSRIEEFLRNEGLVVTIDQTEYFVATILDIDFLNSNGVHFKIEYPISKNEKETRFVSINSLCSADLL